MDSRNLTNSRSGTLVIGILSIESSYAENIERPARATPDTLQFWIGPTDVWRIRTYAIDHDIHPNFIRDMLTRKSQPVDFAVNHINKHYGNVLASIVILKLADTSENVVKPLLQERKLTGHLEVAPRFGFAFWNPDSGHYRSTSTPQ